MHSLNVFELCLRVCVCVYVCVCVFWFGSNERGSTSVYVLTSCLQINTRVCTSMRIYINAYLHLRANAFFLFKQLVLLGPYLLHLHHMHLLKREVCVCMCV